MNQVSLQADDRRADDLVSESGVSRPLGSKGRRWKEEGGPLKLPVVDPSVEEWKRIARAPNYEVSSFGRFRNGRNGRLLPLRRNSKGYLDVKLGRKPGRTLAAHQVALAFPYHQEGPREVVSYIDGDRTNLRFDNLCWTSHKSSDPRRRAFLSGFETLCEAHGVTFERGREAERIAVNLLKLASPSSLLAFAEHFLKEDGPYLRNKGLPPLRLFAKKVKEVAREAAEGVEVAAACTGPPSQIAATM
jgi:hypothetical protein